MTRDAEHTPSPQSVVVPVEPTLPLHFDSVRIAAVLRAEAERLGKGVPSDLPGLHKDLWTAAEIIDMAEEATAFAHQMNAMLAAAPAPSSLAGGEVDALVRRIKYQVECSSGNLIESGADSDMVRICLSHFNDLADEVAALSPKAPAREGVDDDLVAAARRAYEVLNLVAGERRKIGPIATHAQSAAWQIHYALGAEGKDWTPGRKLYEERIAAQGKPSLWDEEFTRHDKAFWENRAAALTPRHEASDSTCQKCGGEVQGWTCQECGASFRENDEGSLVFACHEAPADGAESMMVSIQDIYDLIASRNAFLSETAALRGEVVQSKREYRDDVGKHIARASQAKRQRDEVLGLLRELADGRSQKNNINEYDDLSVRASTLLANQGADQ